MDERHRMHEEHEKARKEKHSEWHRKKDEELRRRLLKVYGNGSEINYGECFKFFYVFLCVYKAVFCAEFSLSVGIFLLSLFA